MSLKFKNSDGNLVDIAGLGGVSGSLVGLKITYKDISGTTNPGGGFASGITPSRRIVAAVVTDGSERWAYAIANGYIVVMNNDGTKATSVSTSIRVYYYEDVPVSEGTSESEFKGMVEDVVNNLSTTYYSNAITPNVSATNKSIEVMGRLARIEYFAYAGSNVWHSGDTIGTINDSRLYPARATPLAATGNRRLVLGQPVSGYAEVGTDGTIRWYAFNQGSSDTSYNVGEVSIFGGCYFIRG